jgi:hypothetical protein
MTEKNTPTDSVEAASCSLLVIQSNPHPEVEWHIIIEVEHQSFALAYKVEDREEAEWMALMLRIALENCGARISPANSQDQSSQG